MSRLTSRPYQASPGAASAFRRGDSSDSTPLSAGPATGAGWRRRGCFSGDDARRRSSVSIVWLLRSRQRRTFRFSHHRRELAARSGRAAQSAALEDRKIVRCLQKQTASAESMGQRRDRRHHPSPPHRSHAQPARRAARHPGAGRITCQFIRLLRHYLVHKTPWRDALPLFQRCLAIYL
jgi:hypothetical protein